MIPFFLDVTLWRDLRNVLISSSGVLVDFIAGDEDNMLLRNVKNYWRNYDVSHPRRPECSVYFFVMNFHVTVPDKEGKMETDTSETEDHRNLPMCNQKSKVFGPVMPPQVEQKPETTSHVQVTKQQCDDEEKGREGKKKRNERRIQQRNKKVLYGNIMLFLSMQYIRSSGARCWWRSWLRHCATNRKVASSIPVGVNGIFHWHNPSGHTMALGLTQPLTEMSTRNISWGVKAAGA